MVIIISIIFMSAGAQHGTEVWYDLQIKKKNSKPTN